MIFGTCVKCGIYGTSKDLYGQFLQQFNITEANFFNINSRSKIYFIFSTCKVKVTCSTSHQLISIFVIVVVLCEKGRNVYRF